MQRYKNLVRKIFFVALGTLFSLVATITSFAQSISNEGSDFWICFPSHLPSRDPDTEEDRLANMSVFITSQSNSSGKVSCGDWTAVYSVTANQVTEVKVPRPESYIENGTGVNAAKGIRVTVDDGKPKVVAYAHVFAGARSAASLVLPVEALGQKYYAIAYTQAGGQGARSQFNIVATAAQTTVKITPVTNGQKGASISVFLPNPGDVYQYQNAQDITGSLIEVDNTVSSCKKIAVFSGSTMLLIAPPGCLLGNNGSADPLFQQLYPIESWGKTFAIIPFSGRENGSIYRFMASENNTQVVFEGRTINLQEGQFFETIPVYRTSVLTANKPITVAQYALTQICSDDRNLVRNNTVPGDPDMVILNPLEYSINAITLYSSTELDISEQYINVTIPTVKVNTFTINHVNHGSRFTSISGKPEFSYAQIDLRSIGGSNFSLAADTGFNAIAYGFGNVESYAYSAGTNLASTKVINLLKQGSDIVVNNACILDKFDFKLTVPYITDQIVWKLSPNEADIVVNNPVYKEVRNGDRISYEYKLESNTIFSTSGVKKIIVRTIPPPSANRCDVVDEDIINYDFEVTDLPVADFALPAPSCPGEPARFTYTEKNVGKTVTSWLWDFGDGSTSALKDPSHIYINPGTYKVKLTIKSSIGCVSDIIEKDFKVMESPQAAWSTTSSLCAGADIRFEDGSSSAEGTISSWLWDFGDNTAAVSAQSPTHSYARSGTYDVKLTVSTTYGCSNTTTRQMTIKDPAVIDFSVPGSCINDMVAFKAEITSGDVHSWEWDFGDGSDDGVEKVKANAQHKYAATGIYNVTLNALSVDGCVSSSVTKTITISGANPDVSFEVLDQNNLCSNKQVLFKNTSTIGFGKITKLEWLLQYNHTQVVTITDHDPQPGEIYSYHYPLSGETKNYQVVLRAYSGVICYTQSLPLNITVNASPSLSFEQVAPVCLDAIPSLLEAKEEHGIAGTFKFTGKGITGTHTFNPALAGVGDHEITYSFLTSKGCVDTLKRIIRVNDLPDINIEEDLDILLAGERQISASVINSSGLTYQWSPAIGLSADNVLDPIASPTETTKYTLTARTRDDCMVIKEVTVRVHIDPNIPNAFSPNGDGVNDTWSVKYLETFVDADIRIFNRYGQEVFYAKQYAEAWNGQSKGKDLPVGVYYYVINPNNGRNKYTGSITLIR
jgi:gliding motility-associated-like protein